MATIAFQLTSLTQDTATATLLLPNGVNSPPANPSQAQGASAQQDAVTLTPQAPRAQGQSTEQNQQGQQPRQFQIEPVFVLASPSTLEPAGDSANLAPPASLPPPNSGSDQTQTPPSQPAPPAPAVPQFPLTAFQPPAQPSQAATTQATAAREAALPIPAPAADSTAPNTSGPQTPQQQLTQLDQALQELGVDPNSITLFNRLALLLYASDPAALAAFVQQLQGTSQQTGQPSAANTGAAAPAAQVQTSNPPQAVAQSANQDAPPALPAPPVPDVGASAAADGAVATISQNPSQAQNNVPAAPANGAANPPAAPSVPPNADIAASANTFAAQFQEVQLAFATAASQGSDQTNGNAPASGNSVNITV